MFFFGSGSWGLVKGIGCVKYHLYNVMLNEFVEGEWIAWVEKKGEMDRKVGPFTMCS